MKAPRISFTIQVFISLIAGILCGLFFGESAQILVPIGNIFIGLMQITSIPSVVIFIVTGIGSIGHEDAKRFLKTVAAILLLIWFLGVLIFFFMQFGFPAIQSASLFSTTTSPASDGINLIDVFIPSNPFFSLAEGLMPAIVLFCLLLGFALIGDAKNRPFVDMLQNLSATFSRITRWVMTIVPLGIFVITAGTFATLTFTQFLQIQVYLITTIVISLLLVLVILPLLTYSLTPFRFREILSAASPGVLMGFSTSHVFITLPQLTEGVASLFRESRAGEDVTGTGEEPRPTREEEVTTEKEARRTEKEGVINEEEASPTRKESASPEKGAGLAREAAATGEKTQPTKGEAVTTEEKARAYSGVLIPLTYTLPSLGVFIVLLFVLFTAWFYGDPSRSGSRPTWRWWECRASLGPPSSPSSSFSI
ncbi:MAG TPA: cation:dicarboxylase symporter family transporter [Methanoregulaceae archaeon]|nr:cation:dicarboxylase symporter family transporter [Methanoregulaceae archaeon]